MKVGSHVIFIGAPNIRTDIPGIKPPVPNEVVYTIRAVKECPGTKQKIAQFEELIIGYNMFGAEIGVELAYLREVDLPPSLVSEIEECLKQELITKI